MPIVNVIGAVSDYINNRCILIQGSFLKHVFIPTESVKKKHYSEMMFKDNNSSVSAPCQDVYLHNDVFITCSSDSCTCSSVAQP